MVKLCCVSGCGHESYPGSLYSFHKFPNDQQLREKWLKLVPGKVISKFAVMCSEHFKEEDFVPFSRRKRLQPGVIPSLFPEITDKINLLAKEVTCFICKWGADREPLRSFYRFPSNEHDRNKWLESIGRSCVSLDDDASVCAIHFEQSCFRDAGVHGGGILKPDGVPTMYLTENIVTAEFMPKLEVDVSHAGVPSDDALSDESEQSPSSDESVGLKKLPLKESNETSGMPLSVICSVRYESGRPCVDEYGTRDRRRRTIGSRVKKESAVWMEPGGNPPSLSRNMKIEYRPSTEPGCVNEVNIGGVESEMNYKHKTPKHTSKRISVQTSTERHKTKRSAKHSKRQADEVSKILSAVWAPNVNVRAQTTERSAAALTVCRICLSLDGKKYHIVDRDLMKMYEQVTGLRLSPGDKLPKMLCWECAGRLRSANGFRDKALRSHKLLSSKIDVEDYLSIETVNSINRLENNLESTLVEEHLGVDYWNGDKHTNVYGENIVKEEMDIQSVDDFNDDCSYNVTPGEMIIPDTNGIFFEDSLDVSRYDDNTHNQVSEEKKERRCEGGGLKRLIVKTSNSSSAIERCKNNVKRGNALIDPNVFTITMLSHEEQIAEIEKRRETQSYVNALYQCTECYKGFMLRDQYELHVARHSENFGSCVCPICKRRFMTNRNLRNHLSSCHTQRFSCLRCPFKSMNRCAARRHEKYHAGIKYKCPNCPVEFDYQTAYLNHMRIKHMTSFVCELCGETFINAKRIEMHRRIKHRAVDSNIPLEGPYCEECDVRFVSEKAHARHLRLSSIHTQEHDNASRRRSYVRRVTTTKNKASVQHPNPNKPLDTITCEQCGEVLLNFRAYTKHFLRDHPDKNRTQFSPLRTPWMCDQCGKILPSQTYLKRHSWVHTGEKYFKCDRCDKSFTNKMSLTHHLKVHGETLPTYPCPQCGKQFSSFSNQQRHMFIHTGQKPYKCQVCAKCFSTSSARRAHVKHVHLGEPWPRRVRARALPALRRSED